jgi:hypothetical protein
MTQPSAREAHRGYRWRAKYGTIRLCEHIEGTDGAVVFQHACRIGLEGIVAKRGWTAYRSGRCRDKITNFAHPAIERAMLIALSKRRRLG